MHTWLIEPRDPLIVRDGRPFGAEIAGARATSLAFPFPSTMAGAVRTRYGRQIGGDFDEALIHKVRSKTVCGPLLVELNGDGTIADWLLPAPSDCLWAERDPSRLDIADLFRLLPVLMADRESTNLPEDLLPVRTPQTVKGKPFSGAPRYWRWQNFQDWLETPRDHCGVVLNSWGHIGPVTETRVHVGIQPSEPNTPSSLTAIEGALYQTRGLEFTSVPSNVGLTSASRLALALATDAEGLKEGLAPIGGERRLASWRMSRNARVDLLGEHRLDTLKARIAPQIVESRACRLILLTPAHFTEGFVPTWIKHVSPGLRVSVRAAAINRPQVVSGWDLDRKHGQKNGNPGPGQPKPTRRLAPAGSVYFLELDANDDDAVKSWIEETWMRCVSDDDSEGNPDQTRLDGFGLAILGVSERTEVTK